MKKLALTGLVLALLQGCATVQPNVALDSGFWNEKDKTVAVVVAKLPPADYMTTGQQGLLDVAINEGANSALNDHLQNLDISEFKAIGEYFTSILKDKGLNVTGLHVDFEVPELRQFHGKKDGGTVFGHRDYRMLKQRVDADQVLLIEVSRAGVVRPYYGFFPTGEPLANFVTEGRLVDLETNRILWRAHFETNLAIQKPWDEPPTFPNVTTAIYKSLEQAKVTLQNDFRIQPAATGASPVASTPH